MRLPLEIFDLIEHPVNFGALHLVDQRLADAWIDVQL